VQRISSGGIGINGSSHNDRGREIAGARVCGGGAWIRNALWHSTVIEAFPDNVMTGLVVSTTTTVLVTSVAELPDGSETL